MLAPASSTKDAAICVTAKMRRRRLVPPVMRMLPLARLDALRSVGRGQTRDEGQQDGGDDRESGADPEHAGVDGEIERANGEARGVARQDGNHRTGDENAERGSGNAEDQALRKQSAAQGAGAGAESGANAELAFAADGAGENEIGDVGAGDDEDEPGRGEQHEENVARAGSDLIAEELGVNAVVALWRNRLRDGLSSSWRRRCAVRRGLDRG